jgi:hypothetical protein
MNKHTKIKPSSKVVFLLDKVENDFRLLTDEDPLKKGIIKAIEDIRKDSQVGENIGKKENIFHNYKKKHPDINNLRVYDLPLAYRLIYTITPDYDDPVKIISIILDCKTHKEYDKMCRKKN